MLGPLTFTFTLESKEFDKFGKAVCPEAKLNYKLHDNQVECIDLNEDDPLPNNLKNGVKPYAEFK